MSTTKVTDNLRETTEVDATKITTGTIPEARITSLDATKLTGTIADARFPATLPAISGANLTNLPATADEITKSTSEPTGTTNPSGGVGTIWLRTTTGEMYCCTDATTNANVWTNIGDGTGNQPVVYTVATGGTITTDGDYKVHTFNSSGTFQITTLGSDAVLEYLVIAGGGTGMRFGSSNGGGGGGGAGGYRTATGFSVSATSYTITVGAGGASSSSDGGGNNGNDSTFSSITSTGGGKGGSAVNNNPPSAGGSGGGTRAASSDPSAASGGAGNSGGFSPVEGYAGGSGVDAGPYQAAGGGGGASEVGADGTSTTGGAGGDGRASSITGSSVTRAGGGGGSVYSASGTQGTGGAGGGTNGTHEHTNSAAANTGSGSGGSERSGTSTVGGGGSGVVILRYKFQ